MKRVHKWTVKRRLAGIIKNMDPDGLSRMYFLAAGLCAEKRGADTNPLEKRRLDIMREVARIEGAASLDAAQSIIKKLQADVTPGAGLYQECIGVREKLEDVRQLMKGFSDTHMSTLDAITNESAKGLLIHSMDLLDGLLSLMDICIDKLDSAIIGEARANAG